MQDIFLTKTAELADVVLPAAAAWAETEGTVTNSERRVQRVRKALDPPGEARDDLAIIFDLARRLAAAGLGRAVRGGRLGRGPPPLARPRGHELRAPGGGGRAPVAVLRRARTRASCSSTRGSGRTRCRGSRAPFVPVDHDPPVDRLDADFPIRLTTGRRLDVVQHRRPVGGLPLAAAPRRDAGPVAGGRGPPALSPRASASASSRVAGRWRCRSASTRRLRPGARLHDVPLPRRGGDEPPDDRRHRPEVRHRRVQGDRDPDREAARAGA